MEEMKERASKWHDDDSLPSFTAFRLNDVHKFHLNDLKAVPEQRMSAN